MSILGSLLGTNSNRPEPSETMQNNAGGLMNRFNPFNLASGMFGKRKPGAADNYAGSSDGMKKGLKNKKDPRFVTKSITSETPVQKGDSVTNISAKLFALFKSSFDKENKEEKIKKNSEKSMEAVRDKRNKELIAALTAEPKGLKKESKDLKKQEDRIKKDMPKQPATPKPETQPPAAAAGVPKRQPAAGAPKGPSATPAAPKGPSAAPAAPKGPPAAPPASAAPAGGASTATRIGVGAGLALAAPSALAAISQAIGKAEAGHGGGYDVAFGDVVTKEGKIKNTIPSKKTKTGESVPTAEEFSEKYLGKRKKLTEFTLEEVKKFQAERDRILPGSGAAGTYQFMPTVLFGSKKSIGLVKQLGLPMDTMFNKDTQDKLQELLISGNVNILKKYGVPITPGYLYMAHYVGAKAAKYVHEAALKGENVSVAEVMRRNKLPIGVNPELEKMKVMEFEKTLEARLVKKGGLNLAEAKTEQVGQQLNTGKRLAEASTEGKDLKKQVAAAGGPIMVNQTNNIVASADNSKTMTVPRSDASTFARGAAT
jgi:hypothetical protein